MGGGVMICTMMEDAKEVSYRFVSGNLRSTLAAGIICSPLGGPDQSSTLVCQCRFSPAKEATEKSSFIRPARRWMKVFQ